MARAVLFMWADGKREIMKVPSPAPVTWDVEQRHVVSIDTLDDHGPRDQTLSIKTEHVVFERREVQDVQGRWHIWYVEKGMP